MKRILAAASLAALFGASAAQAETNYMIGASFSDGSMGISARILTTVDAISTDISFGGGITYYLDSGQIGYDAIAAYMTGDLALGAGYDFSTSMPVFTLGMYQ